MSDLITSGHNAIVTLVSMYGTLLQAQDKAHQAEVAILKARIAELEKASVPQPPKRSPLDI